MLVPIALGALSVLCGVLLLWFARALATDRIRRNVATADEGERRSVIWQSDETWFAAHRAQAPYLVAGAVGELVAAVVCVVALVVAEPGREVPVSLGAFTIALLWVLLCCIVGGLHGQLAARRV